MDWKIPFNKTYNILGPSETHEILDILQYKVINGVYTKKLESIFERMCGVRHAIACANATSGLEFAINYFVNDRRILIAAPTFTWWSTWKMAKYLDFIPYDIDKESWLLNDAPGNVDLVISVDTFGSQSDVKTNIPVIYDAAHGFGISKLGKRGIVEVLSFSFTKIVQGMQGGMILTNNNKIGLSLREVVKVYAKMTEIEAYMCLKSLEKYIQTQEERLSIIDYYRNNIKIPFVEQLIPQETNYSVFAILFETNKIRQKIVTSFMENGIEPKIYYTPVVWGCPIADNIYSRILALPIYHAVDKEKVCEVINKCM